MVYVNTGNVDKLSVPFGVIIGPCTVLSNLLKVIVDVAKIIFYGLLSINYSPTNAYNDFKRADLAWEQTVSAKYKPQVSADGAIQAYFDFFADPQHGETIWSKAGTDVFSNWSTACKAMSSQDKRQIVFEQAKQDSIQHLTFIGVGIIRSLPLVGGAARWIYNSSKLDHKNN